MKKIKVAVMNTSFEVTEMIKTVLEEAGFETCDVFTYKMKFGEVKFDNFVKVNKPSVILYDIAIPYEGNYKLFLTIAQSSAAKNIPFILTTTNKRALEELVGETNALEIMGKPYDLEALVKLVKKVFNNKNKHTIPA